MEKIQSYQLPNLRMIKVTYKGPTNTRGSRVQISEDARFNEDRASVKTFSYDYATGDVCQQGLDILTANGFNVVARSGNKDYYIFLVDNWGDDFKKVSDLK